MREPANEASLLETPAGYGCDCTSVTFGRFMLVPLIPMPRYALQRAAQDRT